MSHEVESALLQLDSLSLDNYSSENVSDFVTEDQYFMKIILGD